MSSTCFKPKGSSSGRRLYMQVWYRVFYMSFIVISACKPYYNVPVYTASFLKMNPRV